MQEIEFNVVPFVRGLALSAVPKANRPFADIYYDRGGSGSDAISGCVRKYKARRNTAVSSHLVTVQFMAG